MILLLTLALLIVAIVLSIRFALAISSQIPGIVENGVSPVMARIIQLISLLYILPAMALVLPFSWLAWFLPLPLGLLVLVSGIVLSGRCSRVLERSGRDVGVEAGRNMANVMWLGISIIIYMMSTVVIGAIVQSYKEF